MRYNETEVIINTLEINANLKFNFHLDNPTYFQNFNLKILSNLMSGGRLGLGFRVQGLGFRVYCWMFWKLISGMAPSSLF